MTFTVLSFLTLAFLLSAAPAFASVVVGGQNTVTLSTGLVGYWTFDGSSINWKTGTALDSSGQGNNGTISGLATTTAPVNGKIGQALNFNGSTSKIVAPTISIPSSISVAAWVYSSNYAQAGFIVQKEPVNSEWELFFFSNGFVFWRGGGATVVTCPSPSNNAWHYMVATETGTTATIYIDGVQCGTGTVQAIANGSGNIDIGADSPDSALFFNGKIDDVRLYNRALSYQEIQQLYALGSANVAHSNTVTLSTGLVGYWTFDGGSMNWKTGTALDSSGQNNNGTLVNLSTTTSPVVGKIGQALNFGKTADHIFIPDSGGFFKFAGSQNFSVSLWERESTSVEPNYYQQLFGNESANNRVGWGIFMDTGHTGDAWFTADYGSCCQAAVETAIPVNDGAWHLIVGERNGTTAYTYVDGKLENTLALTGTPTFAAAQDLFIGQDPNDYFDYNGTLDDVRVYNRALSYQEIQQLYALGNANIDHSNTVTLSTGLVGYWTFDGGSMNWKTGTALDSSGQNNNGQLIGLSTTTSPVIGKIGQALKFDGNLQGVAVNSPPSLPSTFSMFLWIRPTSSLVPNSNFIGNWNSTGWLFRTSTGGNPAELEFYSGTGDYINSSPVLTVNAWQQVGVTYDGSIYRLFYNGTNVYTSSAGQSALTSNAAMYIGRLPYSAGVFGFPGVIDDVRVYNRALSAQEVQQLYLLGK